MVGKKKASRNKTSVKDLSVRIDELSHQLKKAIADYHNLESRIEKEVAFRRRDTLAKLVDKLVGVLDDLERAERHLGDRGLSMAVEQFRRVLESEGVKPIESDGQQFDPQLMDCVEVVKGPKNVVVETVLKGYTLDSEVIRPAKVKVGKGNKV
jgi:molecular chaperone GrpE